MFDIDFSKRYEVKAHVKKFFLYPQNWIDKTNHITTKLNWNRYQFNETNHALIPHVKGIYCFVICPEIPNFFETSYLFYVGKTDRTFFIRYKDYLNDMKGKNKKARVKVFEMLKQFEGNVFYYCAEITDDKLIHECETKLIDTFIPHINHQIPMAKIKPEFKYIYE